MTTYVIVPRQPSGSMQLAMAAGDEDALIEAGLRQALELLRLGLPRPGSVLVGNTLMTPEAEALAHGLEATRAAREIGAPVSCRGWASFSPRT